MDRPSESSERRPLGKKAEADPLASLTLAGLYASQGHTDMAESIYAQLGQRSALDAPSGEEQRLHCSPEVDALVFERLLALRAAARHLRAAGYVSRRGRG